MPTITPTHRAAIVVAVAAAALMLAAFGLASWVFYTAHRESCRSRHESLGVLRSIIALAEPTGPELAAMPAARRLRTEKFFRSAFARIDQARC